MLGVELPRGLEVAEDVFRVGLVDRVSGIALVDRNFDCADFSGGLPGGLADVGPNVFDVFLG